MGTELLGEDVGDVGLKVGTITYNAQSALNYGVTTSYDLEVYSEDGFGNKDFAIVTINVDDVKDAPFFKKCSEMSVCLSAKNLQRVTN